MQVRRAPRYYRFLIFGLLIGGLVTLGVTWMFPEQPDFSRLQVAGLLAIFVLPIGAALGALAALVIDRVSRRRARTIEMERIQTHGDDGYGAVVAEDRVFEATPVVQPAARESASAAQGTASAGQPSEAPRVDDSASTDDVPPADAR